MGFALEDSKVRVDRFKERGKWYDTFVIDMEDSYNEPDLHLAVENGIRAAGYKMEGWIYVCLEPYHKSSHPIMLKGRV